MTVVSEIRAKLMSRKMFIWLLATLLLTTDSIAAQQPAKNIPRIGYLSGAWPSSDVERSQGIKLALRELGYREGENIAFEFRYAQEKLDRYPELAAELVRLNVDIIVTDTSLATQAAKNATKTISVVFTTANDPVGDGQVASLARPGGNLTGFSLLAPELNEKRLELLKESVPKLTRVAFLTRRGTTSEQRFKEAELAGSGCNSLKGKVLTISKVYSTRQNDLAFRPFLRIQVLL